MSPPIRTTLLAFATAASLAVTTPGLIRQSSDRRPYIPGAAKGRLAGARTCMYAMTPDEDFIIDRFPGNGNVVFAAGFSGHGFKFAPLVGELVASLSLGEVTEFPMDTFSLSRFQR